MKTAAGTRRRALPPDLARIAREASEQFARDAANGEFEERLDEIEKQREEKKRAVAELIRRHEAELESLRQNEGAS